MKLQMEFNNENPSYSDFANLTIPTEMDRKWMFRNKDLMPLPLAKILMKRWTINTVRKLSDWRYEMETEFLLDLTLNRDTCVILRMIEDYVRMKLSKVYECNFCDVTRVSYHKFTCGECKQILNTFPLHFSGLKKEKVEIRKWKMNIAKTNLKYYRICCECKNACKSVTELCATCMNEDVDKYDWDKMIDNNSYLPKMICDRIERQYSYNVCVYVEDDEFCVVLLDFHDRRPDLKRISDTLSIKPMNIHTFKEACIRAAFMKRMTDNDLEPQMMAAAIGSAMGTGIPLVGATTYAVKKTAEKLSGLYEQLKTYFEQAIESLKNYCTQAVDIIKLFKRVCVCLINWFIAAPKYRTTSLLLNLTDLFTEYAPNCAGEFVRNIFSFGTENDLVPQMDLSTLLTDYVGMLKLGTGLFAGLVWLVTLKSLPGKDTLEHLFNRTGVIGKNIAGISTLFDCFSTAFDTVINYVKKALNIPIQSEMDLLIEDFDKWTENVTNLTMRLDGERAYEQAMTDERILLHVEELYRTGLDISKQISAKRLPLNMTTTFLQHHKTLEAIYKRVDVSGAFGNRPRVRPVVIWLVGPSQVGKSGMSWPLAIDLNNDLVTDKENAVEFSKNIYCRNVEQEFWDGYRGQNVCIYDDFGQIKDTTAKPNGEFMEIIRTANIAPFPLHMASLEEKSKTRFKSKIVIMTSNVLEQKVNSLTFGDAFRNRIDLTAVVRNKPEFEVEYVIDQNGKTAKKLDIQKVKTHFKQNFHTDVYLIDIVDPFTGNVIESGLSYEQFYEKALTTMQQRLTGSAQLNEYLTNYARDRYNALHPQGLWKKIKETCGYVEEEQFYDAEDEVPTVWERVTRTAKYCNPKTIYKMIAAKIPMTLKIGDQEFYLDFWTNRTSDYGLCMNELMEYKDFLNSEEGVQTLGDVYDFHVKFTNEQLEMLNRQSVTKQYISTLKTTVTDLCNNYPLATTIGLTLLLAGGLMTLLRLWWGFSGDERKVMKKAVPMNLEHMTSGDSRTNATSHRFVSEKSSVSGDNLTNAALKRVVIEGNTSVSGDNLTNAALKRVVLEGNDLLLDNDETVTALNRVVPEAANFSGDSRTAAVKTRMVLENSLESEIWADTTAHILIANRILPNLYKLEAQYDDKMFNINVLFVKGQVALANRHLKPVLELAKEVTITNSFGISYTLPVTELQYIPMNNSAGKSMDSMLLVFPSQYVHSHSDIVKHFQQKQDIERSDSFLTVLPTIRRVKGNKLVPFIYPEMRATCSFTDVRVGTTDLYLRDAIEYPAMTTFGDCGAPIIVQDKRVLNKILGIHCAGSASFSAGQSVTQTDLNRHLAMIPLKSQISLDLDSLPHCTLHKIELPENEEIDIDTLFDSTIPCMNFFPIGKPTATVNVPTQTELRRSLVSGSVTKPITKPAQLGVKGLANGEEVNLMRLNLKKAAMNIPYINREDVKTACEDLKIKTFRNISKNHRRVLTIEEAVKGVEDEEHIGPFVRKTSPGFPWVLDRKSGFVGKTQWLGTEENWKIEPELRSAVEQRIENAKKGIRTPTIWTDTLKDERRPIEKVDSGKTRVFAAGPMDFSIAFRMFFLGYVAHLMTNRIQNEHCIGTNAYSSDWKRIAELLSRKGPRVIAGDFSTFDGTLNNCITTTFVDDANEYYDDGEENALIRQTLFQEVTFSIHYNPILKMMYGWTHSQPSGNPVTTPVNSDYNSKSARIVFKYAIEDALEYEQDEMKRNWLTHIRMCDFVKYVNFVSFGDDNAMNIATEMTDYVNQNTLTKAYAKIGMIYTDESKTNGEVAPYRRLDQINFLKRGFIYDERFGIWQAPLDLATTLEISNWIRESPDPIRATLDNVSESINELSLHSEEIFNEYVPQLIRACMEKMNERPLATTYFAYNMERVLKY